MQSEILPQVVSQHAEDVPFLWLQREQAVHEPHFNLRELATLDGRVEAHLDGLRIAGEAGWRICSEHASEEGVAGAFALGVLAFESAHKARVYGLLERVQGAPGLARGVAAALSWMPAAQTRRYVESLTAAETPVWRRIGLAAGVAHRELTDAAIGSALNDADALVQAFGCQAAGELGRTRFLAQVLELGQAEHETCRFYAAWYAALLGDKAQVAFLLAVAESASRHAEMAMHLALRICSLAAARAWLSRLAAMPGMTRRTLQAAGVLGVPEAVPWLIDRMRRPDLARLAAEAFTIITGADLDRLYLKRDAPDQFEAGPSERSEDDDVGMDPDEYLPWPSVEAVQDWWVRHRGEFREGTRYLLGRPLSDKGLARILREGRQRQRAAAALELALLAPGVLFDVRAPGFRQQRALA
jgi:uncharacterized protein (TIGR02270 family)